MWQNGSPDQVGAAISGPSSRVLDCHLRIHSAHGNYPSSVVTAVIVSALVVHLACLSLCFLWRMSLYGLLVFPARRSYEMHIDIHVACS